MTANYVYYKKDTLLTAFMYDFISLSPKPTEVGANIIAPIFQMRKTKE